MKPSKGYPLKRSPFKVDRVENDPAAFGLRSREIYESVEALYNHRSLLISGPRGIGKSSLGYQLHAMLKGEQALLERVGITDQLPKAICLFYACDPATTLSNLVLDNLFGLRKHVIGLSEGRPTQATGEFEINFGFIRGRLEKEFEQSRLAPSSVALEFVEGLDAATKTSRAFVREEGINIFIDELDKLSPEINFAHFIKIVQENLNSRGIRNISFIFAGQEGIYSRLYNEDNAFPRIVKHVPVGTLNSEASSHILAFAANTAKPIFEYGPGAKELLIAISSGFPDVLHLLGDAAFFAMGSEKVLTKENVMESIRDLLQSDKKELYLSRIALLSPQERLVLVKLTEYLPDQIPARVPAEWCKTRLLNIVSTKDEIEKCIESLITKGFLQKTRDGEFVIFREELFRLFLAFARLEQSEIHTRRAELNGSKIDDGELITLIEMVRTGQIDSTALTANLDDQDRVRLLAELRSKTSMEIFKTIEKAIIDADQTLWEPDDLLNIGDNYSAGFDEALDYSDRNSGDEEEDDEGDGDYFELEEEE